MKAAILFMMTSLSLTVSGAEFSDAQWNKLPPLKVSVPERDAPKDSPGAMHRMVITPPACDFRRDGNTVCYNGARLSGSDARQPVKVLAVAYHRVFAPTDAMMSSAPPLRFERVLYLANNGKVFCDTLPMSKAPPENFAVLFDLYTRGGKRVYLREKELPDADAQRFRRFETENSWEELDYTTDEKNVYWREQKIAGADAQTFEPLPAGSDLSRDRQRVYYQARAIPAIDSASFKHLNGSYWRDQRHIYMLCERPAGAAELQRDGTLLSGGEIYHFIADAQPERDAADDEPFSRLLLRENREAALRRLPADAQTFTFIVPNGEDYTKDKQRVFLHGRPLPLADPATFRLLGFGSYYPGYGFDRQRVFWHGEVVPDADPLSFRMMAGYGEFCGYARDKQWIYYKGKKVAGLTAANFDSAIFYLKKDGKVFLRVPGTNVLTEPLAVADAASFVTFADDDGRANPYAKDRANVYWRGLTVSGANAEKFEPFGASGYGHDGQRLWFEGKPVPVDGKFNPQKFKIVATVRDDFTDSDAHEVYAADAQRVYFNDRVLPGANPRDLKWKAEHRNYGSDEPRIYAYSGGKVYCRGKLLAGVEPERLEPEFGGDFDSPYSAYRSETYDNDALYTYDIYYENRKIVSDSRYGVDALNDEYARVGKRIFYAGREIKGADAETFHSKGYGAYAEDKRAIYFRGERLAGADREGFRGEQGGYAHDRQRVWYEGKVLPGVKPDHFDVRLTADNEWRGEYGDYIYYHGRRYAKP